MTTGNATEATLPGPSPPWAFATCRCWSPWQRRPSSEWRTSTSKAWRTQRGLWPRPSDAQCASWCTEFPPTWCFPLVCKRGFGKIMSFGPLGDLGGTWGFLKSRWWKGAQLPGELPQHGLLPSCGNTSVGDHASMGSPGEVKSWPLNVFELR